MLVASFTDAWIETTDEPVVSGLSITSHLLQMRGLKHRDAAVFKLQQESHLLQMRGLKRERCQCWIMETLSHLLQMRGLKH